RAGQQLAVRADRHAGDGGRGGPELLVGGQVLVQQPDRAGPADGERPVGSEGGLGEPVGADRYGTYLLVGGGAPDLNRVAAGGRKQFAVRAERQRRGGARPGVGLAAQPVVAHPPEQDPAVVTGAGQRRAVVGERGGEDLVVVPREVRDDPVFRDAPQPQV